MIPQWKKNLALWATSFRLGVAPVFIGALMIFQVEHWRSLTCVLFIIASITDWLDGYWARKYDAVTDLGKLLDPMADKVLVSTVLILLIPLGQVSALLVILLLCRDTVVSGFRSLAASRGVIMAANPWGKWKAALQMVAIPMLLYKDALMTVPIHSIGLGLLWLSLLFSLYSASIYVSGALRSKSAL